MLQELVQERAVELLVIAAALAVLATLGTFGCLAPDALDRGPRRRTGLRPLDLLVVFVLFIVAQEAAAFVLERLGLPLRPANATPRQAAIAAIIGQAVVLLPIAAYSVARAGGRRFGARHFGVLPRHFWRELQTAVLALLAALPLVVGANVIAALISDWWGAETPLFGHDMLQALRAAREPWVVLLIIFSATLLAPLLEEIVFRGLVQTALLGALRRRWVVVLLAAGLFAGIHVGSAAPQALAGLWVLGIVLGWVYERTGSLLPCVIVHVGFNSGMLAVTLVIPEAPRHDVLALVAGPMG